MHIIFAIIVWVTATVVFAPTSLIVQIDDTAQKSVAAKPTNDDRKDTATGDKATGITPPPKSTNPIDPARLVKLNKQGTVLLDPFGKRLLLKTKVCLTDGVLEMLVCQEGTKEHESILSIDARSYVVHAGLLALGAKPGRPIQFVPKFSPPTGQEIDIFVTWRDKRGEIHRKPVNEWIRYSIYRYFEFDLKKLPAGFELPANDDLRYDELNQYLLWFGPMTAKKRDKLLALSSDKQYQAGIRYFYKSGQSRQLKAKFVFAGSSFYVDEDTGERQYRGEGGYLICLANFPSATIDIAIESSAEGEGQMFEAWKERLPPKGTDVTVELIPRGLSRPRSKSQPNAEPVDKKQLDKASSIGPSKGQSSGR
jgi:hypothetical protein